MNAVILSIGDELVLGQTVDTNTAYLASRLAELGILTRYHQTLPDNLVLIAQAIRQAADQSELLLVTGGLGPTKDDLTRQALAEAMGVGLELNAESLKQIEAFFAGRSKPMSESNRVQAMLPIGSQGIPNERGTAPGIRAKLGRCDIFVMPGVPHEMRGMFEKSIVPEIQSSAGVGRIILTTKINTFGLGESAVGQLLGDLMNRDRNPTVGTTVSGGIVSVRVRCVSNDPEKARQALEETVEQVEQRLGPIVFGRDEESLAESLLQALRKTRRKIATAESCTGGLIGAMLTDVPGSSDVYLGGWVTYTNDMKCRELDVPEQTIEQYGAVSGQTVCAMARGALDTSHADIAVAVSGIAGPTGGTPDKPVGTVWIGVAEKHNDTIRTRAVLSRFPGDRQAVRRRAALCALQIARLTLLEQQSTIDGMTWVNQTYSDSDDHE
ncbi:MAG: competence/damage-inducible protein A [Phycisphaeraceae bacterium]